LQRQTITGELSLTDRPPELQVKVSIKID
jgi:hypothetical protein